MHALIYAGSLKVIPAEHSSLIGTHSSTVSFLGLSDGWAVPTKQFQKGGKFSRARTISLALSSSCALYSALAHSLSLSHTPSLSRSLPLSLAHSLSLSHTISISCLLSLSLAFSIALALSLLLSEEQKKEEMEDEKNTTAHTQRISCQLWLCLAEGFFTQSPYIPLLLLLLPLSSSFPL